MILLKVQHLNERWRARGRSTINLAEAILHKFPETLVASEYIQSRKMTRHVSVEETRYYNLRQRYPRAN